MIRILRDCWKCWLTLIVVAGLATAAVVTSGIVPVSASTGHWPWTAWMLEFAMERSVSTHSLTTESPPLNDAALIQRGAGHFDLGCAWCHGWPGQAPSRITMSMTPHAPDLGEELHSWRDAELYRIVSHGVMFTAMPAWPDAHRRDEAWAVVAFLKQYHDLDSAAYAELAGRNETRVARLDYAHAQQNAASLPNPIPEVVVEHCVACHGRDGRGRNAYPRLAGQSEQYLHASMTAYRSAARHSGIMGPIAGGLSDPEIAATARYYSQLSLDLRGDSIVHNERQRAGELIAIQGVVKQKLAACNSCHGHNRSKRYPDLGGQRADYLVQQLHLFRSGHRGGTEVHSIMRKVAESLTDDQIQDLAQYYASVQSRSDDLQ